MRNRTTALFVAAALVAAVASAQQRTRVAFPDPDLGIDTLSRRAAAQRATAGRLTVLHDFTFTDRRPESGITWVHRVVDDAAKTYKAVHYDHGNGVGVADVDGDGRLDLYFCNQLGANGLWRNLGGGRFEDITNSAGVGVADAISVGVAFADIDNDGDADLFVSTVRGGNRLFENDGNGVFTDVSESAGVDHVGHSSGAVFFDYDGDGLLDLLVTNVGVYTDDELRDGGFYSGLEDAFQGHLFPERAERSLLYKNLGDNRFREVGSEVGLVDDSWSGDASIVDFNRDGFPDVYVLNMQGSDHFYENTQGRAFAERTAANFPKSPWGAMGIRAFDYDNDGDQDLFLTDMHSDMNFGQTPDEETDKQALRYFYQEGALHLMGNAFWRNDGDDGFTEVSDAVGLENYWPWGTSVGDLNADGYQDVFIASSMNYPFRYQINSALLNAAGEGFVPAEFLLGIEPRRDGSVRTPWFDADCGGADADHERCEGENGAITVLGTLGSRTSAIVDLDSDGDLDIVTGDFNSAPQVLLSDLSERHEISWLKVELEGTFSNRDAIGSTVRIESGDQILSAYHDGKTGYLSFGVVPLYFGLAGATAIDSVTVTWPSGIEETVKGPIAANQTLRLREPE